MNVLMCQTSFPNSAAEKPAPAEAGFIPLRRTDAGLYVEGYFSVLLLTRGRSSQHLQVSLNFKEQSGSLHLVDHKGRTIMRMGQLDFSSYPQNMLQMFTEKIFDCLTIWRRHPLMTCSSCNDFHGCIFSSCCFLGLLNTEFTLLM